MFLFVKDPYYYLYKYINLVDFS